MTNDLKELATEASDVAAHKAKSAQMAVEVAREVQNAQMVEETVKRTSEALLQRLKEVFGESDSENPQQMKVLVRRIPILCTNVEQIHTDIKDIKVLIKEGSADKEERLRAIERNMWKWIGVLLVFPPIVTLLVALLINKLTHA